MAKSKKKGKKRNAKTAEKIGSTEAPKQRNLIRLQMILEGRTRARYHGNKSEKRCRGRKNQNRRAIRESQAAE